MRNLLGIGLVAASLLYLQVATAGQRGAPAFEGSWIAKDAVDDYERAAVVVIRRARGGYELVDRGSRPPMTLHGKRQGGELTFVSRHGKQTTRLVFTLTGGGSRLTEDRYDGSSTISVHYTRQASARNHRRK